MEIRAAFSDNQCSFMSTNHPQMASDQQLLGFVQWQMSPTGEASENEQRCSRALESSEALSPRPEQMQAWHESPGILRHRWFDRHSCLHDMSGDARISPTQK